MVSGTDRLQAAAIERQAHSLPIGYPPLLTPPAPTSQLPSPRPELSFEKDMAVDPRVRLSGKAQDSL